MRKRGNRMRRLLTVLATAFIFTVCSNPLTAAGSEAGLSGESPSNAPEARVDGEAALSAPDDCPMIPCAARSTSIMSWIRMRR